MKTVSHSVHVPTRNLRVAPANTDQWSLVSVKPTPAPEASAPNSDHAPKSSNVHEEGNY
jgi:hypothetical protein